MAVNGERALQLNYWKEHSVVLSLEAMMLDSQASKLDEEERPEILSLLSSRKVKSVIELGAGIGHYIAELAKEAEHVLAMEFIESAIKKTSKIEPESADIVFSNWLLMYLSDEEAGLAEETIEAMLQRYPSIRGINYDLPHVVATASHLPGVEHMGGDMFETVLSADTIFMKGNEDYIRILKSCRKAIPETGKLIIVDVVAPDCNHRGGDNNNGGQKEKPVLGPNLVLVFDVVMVAHGSGGKERIEKEWTKILLEGGYKIITIPDFYSVIKAFPS